MARKDRYLHHTPGLRIVEVYNLVLKTSGAQSSIGGRTLRNPPGRRLAVALRGLQNLVEKLNSFVGRHDYLAELGKATACKAVLYLFESDSSLRTVSIHDDASGSYPE